MSLSARSGKGVLLFVCIAWLLALGILIENVVDRSKIFKNKVYSVSSYNLRFHRNACFDLVDERDRNREYMLD